MRCSRLCIGLIIVGIGGAFLLASAGNANAASLLPFLPLLACPLMCVAMMMFGRKCDDGKCHNKKKQKTVSAPDHFPPSL